jgi:hypothetical protein
VFLDRIATPFAVGGLLLAVVACNGGGAVPPSSTNAADTVRTFGGDASVPATDETSILKKLTKDVLIGSTVDPKNGDTGPHSISIAQTKEGSLKKGQLVICNFADSSGAAGKGTTIESVDPQPSSKPSTFATSSKIEGCDGAATTTTKDPVYGAGFTSGFLAKISGTGSVGKTYGSPLVAPFSNADAADPQMYSGEYIFTSDADTGGIVDFSINQYGFKTPTEVADGFDVNKKSGWSALGPSGLQYDKKLDELYIADGVDDAVVGFTHASSLLVKDEIVVEKHGTAFKCRYPKTTCGKLVFRGAPLDAPVAMALLPNGNLIVANTAGGNTLVEIAANGKVLDTKVVDKSKTAGIFGLAAIGTSDANTALFYTDANTNTVHELEQ